MTADHRHAESTEWNAILERGEHFRPYRRWLRLLPSDPRCELCLAPFTSVGGAFVRTLAGVRPSTLNPRFCNHCERLGADFPGGAEAHVAMLFVDIRGSTGLAEHLTPSAFSAIVDRFYRGATDVLVDAGGLIEKLAGDEVTAIFVRGFAGAGYVRHAIESGVRLLELGGTTADAHLGVTTADAHLGVPIGVGVHTGRAFVGAIGRARHMTTISALGDTVNVAARLASMAGPGELLVSEAAVAEAGVDPTPLPARRLGLKGRASAVDVRVLTGPYAG